jgi:hypothetical protein
MVQQIRFVFAQTASMLGIVLSLSLLGELTLELFIILSFMSLLVATELTAPLTVVPAWRVRVRWLIALSLFIIILVISKRAVSVISLGGI